MALARLLPAHRPVAGALALGLASDVAQRIGKLAYAGAAVPLAGWPRAAAHAVQAAHLAYPIAAIAVAATVLTSWPRARVWSSAAVAWVALSAAAAASYPALRGASLATAYAAFHVAVAVAALLVLRAAYRAPTSGPQRNVALGLALAEVAIAGGPMLDQFTRWRAAQAPYALLWFFATAIQGDALWTMYKSDSTRRT